MSDRATVIYSEIEKHRKIWAAQGPRLGQGTPVEEGVGKLLGQLRFRSIPTITFAGAQRGHDQLVASMIERCGEGAEVWSMLELLLRIAGLKYRGAEAEAAELVRQLERRLPR